MKWWGSTRGWYDVMNISPAGVKLIKEFEGLRLRAYKDIVGVWTIGYGHTRGVLPGETITKAEADVMLRRDLESFEAEVDDMLPVSGATQGQFDALVSLAYNVGVSALKRSTLMRLFKAGQIEEAAAQFARWNKAGGRAVEGLTRRRKAERALFEQIEA